MGKTFDAITDHIRDWVDRQPMYFVATAPLASDGHVNLSPKGPISTLKVLGDRQVAYLDFSGSGAETIAHVRENGRIVIMLCAFDGPPRIVRFHGTGTVMRWDEPGFDDYLAACGFDLAGLTMDEARRSIITVDVHRISDSCGFGVPLMDVTGWREHHTLSTAKQLRVRGPEGYQEYKRTKNTHSLDGLPAVD